MIDGEMWLVIRRQATFWVLYIIIQMCANSLLVLTIYRNDAMKIRSSDW